MTRVSISDYDLDQIEQYSVNFIEEHGVLKLKEGDSSIVIGITKEKDFETQELLRNFHNQDVIFKSIEHSELAAFMGKSLSTSNDHNSAHTPEGQKLHLDKLANDAPIINLVNSILIEGIRKQASDIHIESFLEQGLIRYRIDGELEKAMTIPLSQFAGVSSRLKVMANLNIMERRLPQDGRLTVNIENSKYDLRISIVPIAKGESIVLRIFNLKSGPSKLKDLGLSDNQHEMIQKMLKFPYGLIIVSGPTGSGKTTTLHSILKELNSNTNKIITIEDPVENIIDGIDQIQTHEEIGLTFESILRRVLRQDPNIIMVGEIRDNETAELAVRAAQTGHLVFATLHTNDSVGIVNRLINMGVPGYILASVLRASIAQRLAKRTQGGRLALFEMFLSDNTLEALISKESEEDVLRSHLQNNGFKTLEDDGRRKIKLGLTTLEEVQKVCLIQ